MKIRWLLVCSWLLVFSGLMRAADTGVARIEGLPFEIADFQASPLKKGGGSLFLTDAEAEQIKDRLEHEERARSILEDYIAEADKDLAMKVEPIDESWWDKAKDLPWAETYPQIYEHTNRATVPYALAAERLAVAYRLTGEQKYLDKAGELLLNFAPYQFVAEHYDVGLYYSVWGTRLLRAYDLLWHRFDDGQRRRMDAFMTRLARAVAGNDVYWIEHKPGGPVNNHLAWHKMMLGMLGYFYDRPEMVEFCLHGEDGLVPLLEDGLIDDGLWIESSLNYHFTAIVPMIFFADVQKRIGAEPGLHRMTLADGRTLKQSLDAMFGVLAPDGMIPPIGDAYGYHIRLWDQGYVYWPGWRLWGDPKYAWLLRQSDKPSMHELLAPPLPDPERTPSPPIASLLLPEHGYVFLRSHRDNKYWHNDKAVCAFLTYDLCNVHAHLDALSLMLFGQGRMLLSDVEGQVTEGHAFSARITRELNRGGLSQNTVMIDGRDQRINSEMLTLVEYRDLPAEKRVTAADFKGLLYEGVRQMRTVAMTDDYVFDVFQVDCGDTERRIDWIAHALDEKAGPDAFTENIQDKVEPFALPEAGPWGWLRDARAWQPAGDIALGWREGDAHLRLHMLDPQAQRVILCGYPATNAPESPSIPMVIVRKEAKNAVFAACWLTGDVGNQVKIEQEGTRNGKIIFDVTIDGHTRRHLVPKLVK